MTVYLNLIVTMQVLGLQDKNNDKFSIQYYDCSNPSNLQEVNLKTACGDSSTSPQGPTKAMTILTPRKHVTATGYSCKLTRSQFTYYCGAFSHMKIVQTPAIEIPVPIRADSCAEAARGGRYVDQFDNAHTVQHGENIFSLTEKGSIHETGGSISCQGESLRVNGDVVQDVVRLTQYRLTIEKEKFIFTEDGMEALYHHRKLPAQCSSSSPYCTTGSGHTFVWRNKDRCSFVKIRAIKLEPEDGYWVDHQNKLVFKMGAEKPLGSPCSEGTYFTTEYSDLYLTELEKEFDVVEELSVELYVNSRSDYMQFQAEKHYALLNNQIGTSICRESWFTHRHERDLLQLATGRFTRTKGDILYLFQCEEKLGKVLDTEMCYNKIPLDNGAFVDPTNRVMTRSASEVECDHFPLTVEAVEGWIKIGPGVTRRNAPGNKTLIQGGSSPQVHEDLSAGGLYTSSELKSWENAIEFGAFQDMIQTNIARGVCKTSDSCSMAESHHSSYDLDMLIPREVSEVLDSPLTKVKLWLSTWGPALSLIVCLKMMFDFFVMFVILAVTLAKDGLSSVKTLAYLLLCSCCTRSGKLRRKVHRVQRLEYDLREQVRRERQQPPPSYQFYATEQTGMEEEEICVERGGNDDDQHKSGEV